MTTTDVLAQAVKRMRADCDGIEGLLHLSTPEIERDIHLAAEAIDHAACRLRVLAHASLPRLFDGTNA